MRPREFNSLKEKFDYITERPTSDILALNIPVNYMVEFCTHLRDKLGFDMLLDISGIDWKDAIPRFSVAYHLFNSARSIYVRIVTNCADDVNPSAPSLVSLWPAADWHEREAYDMFGIEFKGHPHLKRILMWEGYPYFPLRKEFPLAGIETEIPGRDVAEETGVKVLPAPMMGGPFRARQAPTMKFREPVGLDESWTEKNPKN